MVLGSMPRCAVLNAESQFYTPDFVFQEPWLCCLNASFLHFTLAFLILFFLAMASVLLHCGKQASGLLDMAWWGRQSGLNSPSVFSIDSVPDSGILWLLRSGAKDEMDMAAGNDRGHSMILHPKAYSEARGSPMRQRINTAT